MMKQKGFSLIATLLIGTIALLSVSGLISFANTNLIAGRRAIASEQAFQAAEAGVEYYRWLIGTGGNISTPTIYNYTDRNGEIIGTYELTANTTADGMSLVSRGAANGAERIIEANFVQGDGVSFYYGVQSGNGGFVLGNGASILGNVYSNADIDGDNGSTITGDAIAVGSISGVDVEGETQTGADFKPLPITDELIDKWKDDADADVLVGNRTISGTNNTLGPVKIQGNLIINGSSRLTVTGTIWVTGSISTSNNAEIVLSSVYGGKSGIVIADGAISLGNNATVNGSGVGGSHIMLISLNDSSAISINNNAGGVVLYAPNGTIDLGNNADISVLAGQTVSLGNNVILEYEQGLIDYVFTNGPSGSWHMQSWQEIQ